jgi:hypothetical protein
MIWNGWRNKMSEGLVSELRDLAECRVSDNGERLIIRILNALEIWVWKK